MERVARGHLLDLDGKRLHLDASAMRRVSLLRASPFHHPPSIIIPELSTCAMAALRTSGPAKAAPVPITPLLSSIPASTYLPLDTPTIMDMMPECGKYTSGMNVIGAVEGRPLRELK
jgi:hypothetical protein